MRGYKDQASDNEREHAGFTQMYNGFKDKLIDLIEKRSNSKTKVVVLGHSRGTTLANQLVGDLVDVLDKKQIVYRGFAPVDFRRKASAESYNKKIEGVDFKNYVIEGDPIRWINNYLPYYKTGENLLITSEDRDKEGGIFKTNVYDVLKGVEQDNGKINDLSKILKSEFAENHGTQMYKTLLSQDSHERAYKKKKDVYWGNSVMNKALGTAMALVAAQRKGLLRNPKKLLGKLFS